jgi:hypothetical protein
VLLYTKNIMIIVKIIRNKLNSEWLRTGYLRC